MLDPEKERAAALAFAQWTPFHNGRIAQVYAGLRSDLWKTGMGNWEETAEEIMKKACNYEAWGVGNVEFLVSTFREQAEVNYFDSLPPLSRVAERSKWFAIRCKDL